MAWDAATARMDRSANRALGAVAVVYALADGVPVSTTPAGKPLTGIFDANHVDESIGQAHVTSTGPRIDFILADLPGDPELADALPRVTVGGVLYQAHSVLERDATRIILGLHEVG